MTDPIALFREKVYEPLGKILDAEGDRGFVTKGPPLVAAFYEEHREILEQLATKPALHGYTRKKVICDNGRHAARCMEWAPDAVSPVHEHGGHVCFDIVLQGAISVTDYRPRHVEGDVYELEEVRQYTARPGEFVTVDIFADDFEAHVVKGAHERSKSLHFYPIDHKALYIYEPMGEGRYKKVLHPVADD